MRHRARALKSTSGAKEAFQTFVAFKDPGDQTPLVVDARKRLAPSDDYRARTS